MQNSQALSRVADWREQNQLLTLTAPDDTGVQQSKKELEDRNHASIQHQSTFSRSRADQPEVLQNLTGSSEREHQTRINSPWFADDYRAYVDLVQRKAEFKGEDLTDEVIAEMIKQADFDGDGVVNFKGIIFLNSK